MALYIYICIYINIDKIALFRPSLLIINGLILPLYPLLCCYLHYFPLSEVRVQNHFGTKRSVATLFRFVTRFARVRIEDSSRNRFALNCIQAPNSLAPTGQIKWLYIDLHYSRRALRKLCLA